MFDRDTVIAVCTKRTSSEQHELLKSVRLFNVVGLCISIRFV